MRVKDDEWCCNGRSRKKNSDKKGVEEHDQEYKIMKGRVSKRV